MALPWYLHSQGLPSGKAVEAEQQAQSIAYSLNDGNIWTTYDSRIAVSLDPLDKYQDQIREFRSFGKTLPASRSHWSLS